VRVGTPNLRESVDLPCEASWELEYFYGFVCMAPLKFEGIRGKNSTPNIGWEVPVNSLDWQAKELGASSIGVLR